jgi:Na+-transporting methylmalonyl-CoA/oxaloacetate decarboxylase gamma subunit
MIDSLFRGEKYTTEELNARLKFFIGLILGLTLFGIVFVVLYSLIFVTQPMNGMSPVDNKFFELIIPIATFLTGTLSGIMLAGDDKELRAKAIDAASKSAPPPSSTPPMAPRPFTPTAPTFSAPAASPFAAAPGPVTTGFGGKLAPPPAHEPEL